MLSARWQSKMATGGYDSVVDSRVTCSVCLEPFKGRQPKLLPCFHTFCSPCLTQLTDRQVSQTLKSPNLSEDDGKKSLKATPVSIICPTCRSPTPLPPGGVSKLQGNFYLDHREEQAIKSQRYLCDLCEEGHEAKHTCAECLTYFCSRCQRTHDKICKKARVSGVNTKPAADGKEQPATNTDVDQVEMVEKVLKKLSEQENKLGQERRAREHDIHVRYATLMRHAGEARDESLASLRDVTQTMNDVIQIDVAMARDALSRLKQRRSDIMTGQQSSGCAEGVISETNRRRLEELMQTNEDLDLLNYQPAEIFREPLVQSILNFMGNVDNQDLHTDSDKTRTSCNAQASYDASLKENTGDALSSKVDQLAERFTHSEQLVTTLQAQNTLLCRDLASVHDRNDALLADVTALKKEMTSLRDEGTKIRDDVSTLRNFGDKTSLLCQENQQLRTDLNSLQADTNTLQGEQNTLKAEHDKLESKLQTDVGAITSDVGKLKQHTARLGTDTTSLQDTLNKASSALTTLEKQMSKASVQMAFHARLSGTTRTKVREPLICDRIITSVGGGYNDQTGVFTAPVSGCYCFMVTSCPNDTDLSIQGRLDIMLDNKDVAYLYATGDGMCASHAAVHVNAGQKVWLESYGGSTFCGSWRTTFTGVLLQPDL